MDSETYWREREDEALKIRITDEKEYEKELHRIYSNMLDACQNEINAFYGKYASKEGISLSEAKKRVSAADIAAYERKAAQYVKTKDFSDKANEEMRLYNTMMKINRLEMLKANIGLELISGHDELEKFMAGILQGRTEDELKRQAGILGKTVQQNAKTAHAIVNASFHVAKVADQSTFSDRIWQYQDLMRDDLGVLLQRGLIQGKNPRAIASDLKKYWYGKDPKTGGGATYCMERLMRTELARVQTEAQKQSFERNGFKKYIFIVNHNGGNCCPDCQRVADNGPYSVAKMMPGLNAPPLHPHCVLPDTKIIAPDMEAMTKSMYSGDVVEFGTTNGTRLTVTANHIMLTTRGWVRAKNLIKGDKVIRYCGGVESMIEPDPANNDCVPTVEQLFASLVKAGTMPPLRMPAASEDFKGDAVPNSEVDIVFVDSELRDKLDSHFSKCISDVLLVGASVGSETVLPVDCSLAKLLVGFGLSSDGIMSGRDVAEILFRGAFTHHELVGFRSPSDYYARLQKTAANDGTANGELFCNGVFANSGLVKFNNPDGIEIDSNTGQSYSVTGQTTFDSAFSTSVEISDLLSAFSGIVAFDDITFVTKKFYSGHVYDVSSLSTLYIANNYLSSNCRCSVAAYEDSAEYEAWLDHLAAGGTTISWQKMRKSIEKSGKDAKMKLPMSLQNFASKEKQYGKKIGKHAYDYGLDPSKEADRIKMHEIIDDIIENYDEIRTGFWRGQSEDVNFYIKGEDVVIRSKDEDFISILKGGITNARVKNARKQ